MENFCVKCGRYHNYESPCPESIPVCKHGQLARQCRLCELEAELSRMRPVFDAAVEWGNAAIEYDDREWEGTETIGDIAKDKRFNELCQLLGTGERALIAAVRKLDR